MPKLKRTKKDKVVGSDDTIVDNTVIDNTVDIYEACKGKVSIKQSDDYISTGITLLNLVFTNNKDKGFQFGQFVELDGVKHAGKTVVAQNIIACACYDTKTKNFIKKYVDAEKADNFDKEKLYGKEYIIQVSDLFEEDEIYTLDKFYDKAVKITEESDVPVIIVLDSLNSLISDLEKNLFDDNMKRGEAGKEKKQDYTSMKVGQINSSGLKRLNMALSKNKGIVIILTQMRSNTDAQGTYAPKFKASTGGNSLSHYNNYTVQMSVNKKIEEF